MARSSETEAFWSAADQGRLVVERCTACGAESAPPRGACRACGSVAVESVEATEGGRLWSWTVNHQRWFPELPVPYVVGLVELIGHPGVRLLGRLDRCAPDDLTVGMGLEIAFEAGVDGEPALVFRPTTSAAPGA